MGAIPSMAADSGTEGAIVANDEPLAPRRTAVRVMHDICTWLLDLGLPVVARRANTVAEESERLAVKKAQVSLYTEYWRDLEQCVVPCAL